MPNSAGFKEIEKTFQEIDANFDALYSACQTMEQRERLRALFSSARDAYWKAVSAVLVDNNPVVAAIRTDLKRVNDRLTKDLASLKNISATLNLITEAVRLAGSLTTLAAA
jgi:hypothetical protein